MSVPGQQLGAYGEQSDPVLICLGNLGDEIAVFEPVHGSAPKYTGMNKVNPIAMMFSGAMMLRHIGEQSAGDRLEGAIAAVIAEGESVTYDMKPTPDDPTAVGTSQVADAVIERLKEQQEPRRAAPPERRSPHAT